MFIEIQQITLNNTIIEVRKEITEEHIVYTDPTNCIAHYVIEEGQGGGNSFGKQLVDIVIEFDSQDTLECVVADGTAVMTGCYNGMIASEKRVDGWKGTSGPNSFHGPMGTALTTGSFYSKDIITFDPIKAPHLPYLHEKVVKVGSQLY